jgi:hypothetical protein
MKARDAKPVLLLDVDGVLNVIRDAETQARAIRLPNKVTFYPLPVSKRFLRWAWKHFDVRWLTSWFSGANLIAEWASLPPRPAFCDRSGPGDWKFNQVRDSFKDHKGKVVWIEDGIVKEAQAWVDERPNVKYIHTDTFTGITQEQILEVAKFIGVSWYEQEG